MPSAIASRFSETNVLLRGPPEARTNDRAADHLHRHGPVGNDIRLLSTVIARTPLHSPGHARPPAPRPLGPTPAEPPAREPTRVDGSTVHPFQVDDLARDRMRARRRDAETDQVARAAGWRPARFPRGIISLLRRVPAFTLRPASSPSPIEAVLASHQNE
jgi:hypothetical protein